MFLFTFAVDNQISSRVSPWRNYEDVELKKVYILIDIVLLAMCGFLALKLLQREPMPKEKALSNTPKAADTEVDELFRFRAPGLSTSALAFIGDSKLFSPSRLGSDKKKKAPPRVAKKTEFELIGLLTLGDTLGAIIIIPATRGAKQGKKRLYRIGEPVGKTGYKLLEIRPKKESAVLGAATSQVLLKLERNDKGSLARRKSGQSEKRKVISITANTTKKKPPTLKKAMAARRRSLLRRKSRLKRHLPSGATHR